MPLISLTHVGTRTDDAGASLLSFRPQREFAYRAGQFGLWIVGASARPFTIASAPRDGLIDLGTRLHAGSRIKRALSALRPGGTVRLLGPLGRIAPPDDGTPVTYLVQGVGITAARALLRQGPERPQRLIHVGIPYFRGELEPMVDTAVYPGSRQEFATEAAAAARAGGGDVHFVIAGSTSFVRSTKVLLRGQGVARTRIHADGFVGLSDGLVAP